MKSFKRSFRLFEKLLIKAICDFLESITPKRCVCGHLQEHHFNDPRNKAQCKIDRRMVGPATVCFATDIRNGSTFCECQKFRRDRLK